MNATEIAAALSARAEDVCRRYLPRGRKQGRYWTIGDTSGAKGRSLFVRLAPPGIPGKWTDAATNEHGDLLDLIRLHTGGASLRHAMEEALAFLSLRQSTPANGGNHAGGYDREEAARRLWRRCRPIDGTHAEAYLHARAIGHCRFPALRFHPDLIHRGDDGIHRLPALVAAVTGDDGAIEGVQRTWLDPKRPAKANPRPPAQSAWARPRPRRSLRRNRLRRDPACRRGHRNRAIAWSPPSPVFMPPQLFRRAASAPSNRPKISPCWSSPAIKTWRAGTPQTVFSSVAWNAAFPQS